MFTLLNSAGGLSLDNLSITESKSRKNDYLIPVFLTKKQIHMKIS